MECIINKNNEILRADNKILRDHIHKLRANRPDYTPPEVKEPGAEVDTCHKCGNPIPAGWSHSCGEYKAVSWNPGPHLAELSSLLLSARADILTRPDTATKTINVALDLVAKMEGGG